ncbi:MAG TPA: FecR family protein [Stellaceae bacterium]|nr:FecR family protein [Stellaceae bacterium]
MRASRRHILLGAGTAALGLPLVRSARADAPAGSVVGLRGQCLVERQGHPAPLKMGDAVAVSDTIEVPADGKLKLRMQDGSVLSLASGTKMTVAAYQTAGGQRQNVQLSLAEGLIRAVVAPVDHPATFEVSTAVGTAAVRSTDWFIEAKPGSAQVGVLTGNVSLSSTATGRTVTIPSRWGARLEAGRDPVPARVWSPQEFQAVISRTDVP